MGLLGLVFYLVFLPSEVRIVAHPWVIGVGVAWQQHSLLSQYVFTSFCTPFFFGNVMPSVSQS